MSKDNLTACSSSVILENQVMKSIHVKRDNSFMSENVAIYYLLIVKY